MSRRRNPPRRELTPDPKYRNVLLARFMNNMVRDGKKSVSEGIVYRAFERIEQAKYEDPLEVFKNAIDNVSPNVEVRSRRVGGATYQVPVSVRADRRTALAIRWLIAAARKRNETTMTERLASELIDASERRGSAFKKRDDTHRMAEANRAFSHYRW